jgi:phage-related tail fiber protein
MAEIANTYGTIVTDIGNQLITEAVMEGQKVNIVSLAVGDGGGSYYKPDSTMTALKGEKWRGSVTSVQINENSPNMIDIVAVVPSSVGGWTIREMGVFDDAEEADGGPNMIAVCNTPDTEKVIITSGAAGEIELTMHIEISNTGAISFIVDPNVVTATKKDIETHNASAAAHAAEFEKKADVTDLNAHANNSDIHVNPTTMGNYDTAISGLIEHTEDDDIHVTDTEKTAWTAGAAQAEESAEDVEEALSAIAGLTSRVSRVEDGLFNNITGNPYLVQFDSLDGVVLTKGVWNTTRNRIEC